MSAYNHCTYVLTCLWKVIMSLGTIFFIFWVLFSLPFYVILVYLTLVWATSSNYKSSLRSFFNFEIPPSTSRSDWLLGVASFDCTLRSHYARSNAINSYKDTTQKNSSNMILHPDSALSWLEHVLRPNKNKGTICVSFIIYLLEEGCSNNGIHLGLC